MGLRAVRFFPLLRPTAKKPLRSKQHKRGLCGGERESPYTWVERGTVRELDSCLAREHNTMTLIRA